MNGTNNPQVLTLLNGAGKPASEMTRGLSVLGDGSMADGLIALWENGQKNGIVKGAVVTSLVFTMAIGLYALAKDKIAEQQAKQTIRAACTTVEAVGMTDEVADSENLTESTPEQEILEVKL